MTWHLRNAAYIYLLISLVLCSLECASGTGPRCNDNQNSSVIQAGSEPKCRDIEPPKLIHCVDPMYPSEVRKQRLEGRVVVDAVLTPAGLIDDMKVRSSPGEMLTSLALAAFRERRYKPAKCRDSGEPVRVYVTLTVTFALRRD
jgi:TonB family protein